MISCRIYTAASHDSVKPLFSHQNFLQLSAFRKMANGKRRRGSFNSRGSRPLSSGRSPRSSQSASYSSSMHQKDEPSISTSDIKDNGHCHIGGRQHERMVGEESQDSYSSSRLRRSPFAQDSLNSCKSVPYEISMYQKDEPSIATSDIKDNGPSHIGGCQHELMVGEGGRDMHSSSKGRRSPFAQDSPNSHKSNEQMFHDRMLGEGNRDGNLSYRVRRSPSVEDSSNTCESASYEGQKDEPSIATSDVNDNGHSHIGGRQHEQKVGEGSQDRHSILRPRHTPSAQDSHNSRKSASYEGQKDKPSIATSDVNDNGRSHISGREHERKVGEGSQDGHSISRSRHSPSAQDSPNSHKSGLFPKGSRSRRIGTSPASVGNADSRSHVGRPQHQQMLRHSQVAANSILGHVECSLTVSFTAKVLIQDGAANCNLPQQIDSTEKGMETGFDICPKKPTAPVKLKPSLFSKNKEKRKEQEQMDKGHQIKQLRSGMFLLKNYLGHSEQVEVIRECHRLGLGKGGFYQPGYSDGAKLHLQMMCLGKYWDPENKYRDRRLVDDVEPPSIPDGFKTMVKRSLQDSHDFKKQDSEVRSVEDMLPNMKPDLCIVNFYTDNGKLGMHQDKDESLDSLHKGLPVVSFSIGDSAEFLYGDDWSADKADKVILESGDVLIFGGKSRHIFHGVSSILPGTAPKLLVEEMNLRPGRLNLTFRQY